MIRKLTAAALCLLLTVSAAGPAVCLQAAPAYDAVERITKDETVYVNLDGEGAVSGIDVVNRIETPQDGAYTDYGDYETITNLTGDARPQVSGDAVTWQLAAGTKGFYYQGKLRSGEPPFLFDIKYFLDGAETPADKMPGRSGSVSIRIDVTPNGGAADYFSKNYFCQIQASLDLDRCRDIRASGATGMIAGRTRTLGFTALPGRTASYEIDFVTDDFSFGGFTMTAMPFDQKGMTGIDTSAIGGDIKRMSDGTQALVDGTKSLKDGLATLSDGVKALSDGAGDAKAGMVKYKSGLKSYTGGVSELSASAQQIAAGMQDLAKNGQALKTGYASLSAGLGAMLSQLAPMLPPETAGQVAALQGQLAAYGQGLDAYVDGVSQMASGMQAFSDGLKKLGNAGPGLTSGLADIVEGMASLADGLGRTAGEMNKLPGEVQKLIDGQTELRNGIAAASGTFSQWDTGGDATAAPVSFVSEKNAPRSVQFVYRTPELVPDDVEQAPETALKDKGFWEKLADLFR